MAAMFNFDPRKRSSHQIDRTPRDGANGMSASTKRHFDQVKRKMFAFVDRQHRAETIDKHLAPPQAFHQARSVFVDQNKAPKHRRHHHTPGAPRRQLLPHNQLPHLALATPKAARRSERPKSNFIDEFLDSIAFF